MSKKFRNSLFGFNKEDVLSFVVEAKENEVKYKKSIDELNSKIDELEQSNSEFSKKYTDTMDKLSAAEEQLRDFERREAALTHLSESIGRLYLVAQANANAIITSANENVKLSQEAVERNISVATSAEQELAEISRILDERTKEYSLEIASLKRQITDAKERISVNCSDIAERQSELEVITTGVEE